MGEAGSAGWEVRFHDDGPTEVVPIVRRRGRVAAILEAVAGGAQTSRAVADLLGESIYRIAPEMDRLGLDGRLVRCGHVAPTAGRPCVRWRAR